jgi:hypothetical protein
LVGVSLIIVIHLILRDKTGLWDPDGDPGGRYVDNMVTAGNPGSRAYKWEP